MNRPMEKVCVVCHREFPSDVHECPDDRVVLTEKDARIGTIFDNRYEILDFIGAGGLSRVYKARHVELNRVLALKVLKSSELIDVQRFRREAISISQLDHPNIARVFSFSVAPNGCPYMALEFLDGRDLAEWLAKEGPLNLRQALIVFEQVAGALEHAHSRNIIHRDIKPGNIVLLCSAGDIETVRVVDFGMAKFQLESSLLAQKLSQEGEVFGTRQYISPEQYRGVVADARADIYSLGVTMYESVLKDAKIPELLRPVISKATETDPTARYQSSTEMREELLRLKESLSAEKGEPGSGYVAAERQPARDLFGMFYFWTMLGGMLVIAVAAIFLIRQRMAAIDSVSAGIHNGGSAHVAVLGHGSALSYAAAQREATSFTEQGKLDEAVETYEAWLQRNRNSEKWSTLCDAQGELSSLFLRLDNIVGAEKSAVAGMSIARKHGLDSSAEYEQLLINLALVRHRQGEYQKSIELSSELLKLTQDMEFNREVDTRLAALSDIASCQLDLDQLGTAKRTALEELDLSEKMYGTHCTEYARACAMLALITQKQKDFASSLSFIQKSRQFYASNPKYFNNFLLAVVRQAAIQVDAGQLEAARSNYDLVKNELLKNGFTQSPANREILYTMESLAATLGLTDDQPKWHVLDTLP